MLEVHDTVSYLLRLHKHRGSQVSPSSKESLAVELVKYDNNSVTYSQRDVVSYSDRREYEMCAALLTWLFARAVRLVLTLCVNGYQGAIGPPLRSNRSKRTQTSGSIITILGVLVCNLFLMEAVFIDGRLIYG